MKYGKYDFNDKINELSGFYEWNKDTFLINKNDKRCEDYKNFKKENGFYPDECWSLYSSICMFIIPRLKYFREHTGGYPVTVSSIEEWQNILDKMIWSFEESLKDDVDVDENIRELYNKDVEEGLNLFSKYFLDLWW